MKAEITQDKLHDLFDYKDGNLYWKNPESKRVRDGDKAGTVSRGFCCIQINKKKYSATRLIYFYHHGYFPENKLICINKSRGVKIENLEESSLNCIQSRQKIQVRNHSKIKGIHFDENRRKWRVEIKRKFLGYIQDFLEACCLRYAAEQCLGWDTLSESSAAKYVKEHIRRDHE